MDISKLELPQKIFDVETDEDIKKIYMKFDKDVNRTMIQLIGSCIVSCNDDFGLKISVVYKPNAKHEVILKNYGQYICYIKFLKSRALTHESRLCLGNYRKPLVHKEEVLELTILPEDGYKITNVYSEVIITYIYFSDDYKKTLQKRFGTKTDPRKNGFI